MKLMRWQRNVLYVGLAGCLVAFMFPPVIFTVTSTSVTYQDVRPVEGRRVDRRVNRRVDRRVGSSPMYEVEVPVQNVSTRREWRFALDVPSGSRIDIGMLLLEIGIIGVASALSVIAGASVVQSARRLGRTRALAPLVATLTRFARHLVKADTRASLWGTIKRALTWWLPVWWGCTALALVWGHYREAAGMAVVGSVILSVAVVVVSLPFGLMRRHPSDATHVAGWRRRKRIAAVVVLILFASGLALAGPARRWADDMERREALPRIAAEMRPPEQAAESVREALARIAAEMYPPEQAADFGPTGQPRDDDSVEGALDWMRVEREAVRDRRYARLRRAREDMNPFVKGFVGGIENTRALAYGAVGMGASALGARRVARRSFERYRHISREAETYE